MSPAELAAYRPEEVILDRVRRDGQAAAEVYRYTEVSAVLGRGGKSELELDAGALDAADVPVLRRRGGGCAVVLDPGNLVVSVAVPLPGIGGITSSFATISRWLIEALAQCDIPGVKQMGVSDLVLDNRKIGGSCIYRSRGLLHYSTTLLVDPDLDLIDQFLPHPPREPDYRRGRQHRDFVTTLRAAGLADDPDALAARLEKEVLDRLPRLVLELNAGGRTAA